MRRIVRGIALLFCLPQNRPNLEAITWKYSGVRSDDVLLVGELLPCGSPEAELFEPIDDDVQLGWSSLLWPVRRLDRQKPASVQRNVVCAIVPPLDQHPGWARVKSGRRLNFDRHHLAAAYVKD